MLHTIKGGRQTSRLGLDPSDARQRDVARDRLREEHAMTSPRGVISLGSIPEGAISMIAAHPLWFVVGNCDAIDADLLTGLMIACGVVVQSNEYLVCMCRSAFSMEGAS